MFCVLFCSKGNLREDSRLCEGRWLFTDNLSSAASTVLGYLIDGVFILATLGFLVLAFSRYGRIKLGNDDDVQRRDGSDFFGVAEASPHLGRAAPWTPDR